MPREAAHPQVPPGVRSRSPCPPPQPAVTPEWPECPFSRRQALSCHSPAYHPSSCSSPWCLEQNPNPSLCPLPVGGGPVPPPTPHHSTAAPDTQVTPAGPVLRSLPAPALKEVPSCLPGCPVSFIPPFIIVPNYLWLRSPVPVCPPPRTSCEFGESRGLCVPRACRPHSPNICKATRNSSRG